MELERLKVFGHADLQTLQQMDVCLDAAEGAIGRLMPDNHLGYSQPVGGVVAYPEHVSVSGVGPDIACGNKAVMTDLHLEDVREDMPRIMDEVFKQISFGVGRHNNEEIDHPVLDQIENAPFEPQRKLLDLARRQLGTVGAGNHYVDIFADQEDRVWVGVHFGSRGFGFKTAAGFSAIHAGGTFEDKSPETGPFFEPVLFRLDSPEGQAYIEAMELAGEYAYAGRDIVVDKVLDILGGSALYSVHNHHNFSWLETHNGTTYHVARKGATPAFPGQEGFVGATMGEESVILAGTNRSAEALFSTVHGAGRKMSRTKAAGRFRYRKRYRCETCGKDMSSGRSIEQTSCPDHPDATLKRVRVREQVAQGEIDFGKVQEKLSLSGIELRGGAADEAPGAYKRLHEILEFDPGIEILHRIRPIGVAMAKADTFDPFKD